MKSLVKLLNKPDFWPIVFVLLMGVLASRTLFGPGYFNMHDDLQVMRQLSMEKCFLDGQIPCRWIPDMGYGFGYPLFNFYPPLPYLVGELMRVVGYSFIASAKGIFIIAILASGITMYYLAREFFGKLGGVVAATFYIWAPYHAVDVYVRGAMNEAWALIWFPAIMWTSYKLISSEKNSFKWVTALALAWFALFTSHNLMVIVFAPFFSLWVLLWLVYYKKWSRVPHLAIAGVWSFGLAAFFTLPVLFEKGIVQTESLVVGYYEYTAHFPSIKQLLFTRFWGYGPSVWMDIDDKMSFQIGWFHWVGSIVLMALAARDYLKNRKISRELLVIIFLFVFGWFAAFMAHPRSTAVWQAVKSLQFVQFPWRYLTMVILAFSFLAGSSVKLLTKGKYLLVLLAMLGVIVYSWNYFLPEHGKLGSLTDEEKLSGAAWDLQQTAGIYDYLPNTARTAPKAPMKELALVLEGEADVRSEELGTNWARFTIDVYQEVLVQVGILQFPNWRAYVDGVEVGTFVPDNEEWGRIHIFVPEGTHTVELELEDTPVRTVGNYLSLASWAALGILLQKKYKQRKSL
ncbi:hypothetical protein C4564_04420 [Candidatus Microgenomates bacterium]|nr:MAG: hypothetical protein C4564_04420 [Candidatus Microgenomates bacterium]